MARINVMCNADRNAALLRKFLPVRVLSRMFRGLFLHYLEKAFAAGELNFFSAYHHLQEPAAFRRYLAPVHGTDWVIYVKRQFAGPAQVLDYVGRYTHRVAISNNRLVSMGAFRKMQLQPIAKAA
jgi:hypothetical protein